MRIGMFLEKGFPPDPRVENEALSLISKGHQVYLFCIDYSKNKNKIEVINGINIHRISTPVLIYKLSALAYTLPFYHLYFKKYIINFIEKYKIESLHIHDIQIARSIFWANKKLNLPIVLDLHENRPEIMQFYSHVLSFWGKLLIHKTIWKKFEYKYIKQADKVIVVTEEAKEYYLKEIKIQSNRICVVPNTVNKSFNTNYLIDNNIINSYKNNYVVLYLGDTGERRGLETVIYALEFLISEIPEIKIVIVGTSIYNLKLQNIVSKLGFQDYIEFAGWKDMSLFQSYIISSHIGISPIYKNIHHDTTYANKIFQYLAFGKPIVASNCMAQQKVVEKYQCGLVFEEKNSRDFANKILTLYKNKDLYKTMSDNANIAINELYWEILSKNLINLYSNGI